MAITWPAKNNFATGDVLTATQMNNIGDDLNDLNTRVTAAGGFWKNPVLNSNMSVWQRGTSISVPAASTNYYTADRWGALTGASQASTVSRQATNDTTNLPNIQYCARFQRNSGQTGTAATGLFQSFETINSVPFAGKTVTLSFYARAGANYSSASNLLSAFLYTGTGTDQAVTSGYTGNVNAISQTPTLTTTWQRFSYSATLNANITEIGIGLFYTPVGTAGANDYFEVTGVQLEVGSSATSYYPNGNTYQAELAACQRYYVRFNADSTNVFAHFGLGIGASTTQVNSNIELPVSMRIPPQSIDYSNLATYDTTTITAISTAVMIANQSNLKVAGILCTVSSGLTSFRPYFVIANNNSAAYVGFSAEL